jgi:hypothetical protein
VRVRVRVRVSAMRRRDLDVTYLLTYYVLTNFQAEVTGREDLAVLRRVGGCKGEGTRLDIGGPHGGGARESSAHLVRATARVGGLGSGSGSGSG